MDLQLDVALQQVLEAAVVKQNRLIYSLIEGTNETLKADLCVQEFSFLKINK